MKIYYDGSALHSVCLKFTDDKGELIEYVWIGRKEFNKTLPKCKAGDELKLVRAIPSNR
jgi:hypothetical protein